MLDLEHQLAQRHPRWFKGPHARIVKPLLGRVQKATRLGERILQAHTDSPSATPQIPTVVNIASAITV